MYLDELHVLLVRVFLRSVVKSALRKLVLWIVHNVLIIIIRQNTHQNSVWGEEHKQIKIETQLYITI